MRCVAGLWGRRVEFILSGCFRCIVMLFVRVRVDHPVRLKSTGFWLEGWVWSKMLPLTPKRSSGGDVRSTTRGSILGGCLSMSSLLDLLFASASLPHFPTAWRVEQPRQNQHRHPGYPSRWP